jgi:Flp pilus assembly protein TadG
VIRGLPHDASGSAAAEMALILPLLLILVLGTLEAGNLMWSQHKVTKAVRDGARYAARQNIALLNCSTKDATVEANIKLLTRTGQLASTTIQPKIVGWSDDGVTVTVTCNATYSGGIYSTLSGGAPVVTVAASPDYRSLLGRLGLFSVGGKLRAEAKAPVMGI